MGAKLNLLNQRFGRLLVIEEAGRTKSNKVIWKCQCDCGNIHYSTTTDLRHGDCTSCGCYHKEKLGNIRRKHGRTGTRLYKVWIAMKGRCYNPNNLQYSRYGGRGIKVCDEWQDFEKFETWSNNNGYTSSLSIDRINNDGDYEPSNCRWTDSVTQVRNRSITRKVKYNGEDVTIKELSERYNVNYYNLYDRIVRNKLSIEDAVQDLLNC